jgi:hypothetical protein
MLRFSLRRRQPSASANDEPGPTSPASETLHVNRTSSTWLNFRKRTISVESISSLFTGVGRGSESTLLRRESQNSTSGGSMTGGPNNARLMRTHKMCTKSGEVVEIFFGYDALTVDGRPVAYGDVVFWSHSASHWKLTYMSLTSGKRREIVLYPYDREKGPLPSDLTEMIEQRIARLVKDQTGCTTERAIRMATREATETELQQAITTMEGSLRQASNAAALGKSPDDDGGGVIEEGDEGGAGPPGEAGNRA